MFLKKGKNLILNMNLCFTYNSGSISLNTEIMAKVCKSHFVLYEEYPTQFNNGGKM
jgi:hypothetical protein